jgi:hypothetical protein
VIGEFAAQKQPSAESAAECTAEQRSSTHRPTSRRRAGRKQTPTPDPHSRDYGVHTRAHRYYGGFPVANRHSSIRCRPGHGAVADGGGGIDYCDWSGVGYRCENSIPSATDGSALPMRVFRFMQARAGRGTRRFDADDRFSQRRFLGRLEPDLPAVWQSLVVNPRQHGADAHPAGAITPARRHPPISDSCRGRPAQAAAGIAARCNQSPRPRRR